MAVSDNMEHWQKLCAPPAWALKPIQAGRLKGKSDINPQWRMMAMTDTFGPCGTGWKYTIDKLWLEKAAEVKSREGNNVAAEVTAFALVSVSYKVGEHWSEPIPGIGGSMFTEMEKSGPFNSDEAYKMAVTDALSVAFKALGMAANIYSGDRFDGSKYMKVQGGQQGQGQQQQGQQSQQKTTTKEPATQEQIAKIHDLILAIHNRDGGDESAILKTISHFVQNDKEYFLTPETLAKNCSKGWAGKIIGKAEGMLKA